MISVSCPDCGKAYKLKPTLIGKKGRCKVCDASFTIEDSSAVEVEDHDDGNEYAVPVTRQSAPLAPEKRDLPKPTTVVADDGDSADDLPELPVRQPREVPRREIKSEAPARPKTKPRSSSTSSGFALGGPVAAMASAAVGGGIGAVIWGAIAYFAHAEVGYVAWGVGGLVGLCVRMAAEEMDEGIAGIIAATGAVISILLGKLLAGYFMVQWLVKEGQIPAAIADIAQMQLIWIAFKSSFGIMDIIFFVLAIATAYRLGSGQSGE